MSLKSGQAAAIFLPLAWCLAAERIVPELFSASCDQRRILSIGSLYQIGLEDVVLPKLEAFAREVRTVVEVMVELIQRTVQQHLRVAWTRFAPPQGKDVSVIVADNETWARNIGKRPASFQLALLSELQRDCSHRPMGKRFAAESPTASSQGTFGLKVRHHRSISGIGG
jgi:hypothetical protein